MSISTISQTITRIAVFIVVAAGAAHAHNPAITCGGEPVRWTRGRTTMHINIFDYPPGSAEDTSLQTAMARWNNVKGSSFTFFVGRDSNDTNRSGNGLNEIYRGREAGSALAVTLYKRTCFFGIFGWRRELDETDIVFNRNVAWTTAPFNFRTLGREYSLEGVASHELGHAMGLGHEDGVMTRMNPVYPGGGPLGHFREWDPLGDDRNGARRLYPDNTTETDVAGSMFRQSQTRPGESELLPVSPRVVARGESLDIQYTVSNLGTSSGRFDVRFYLSTNRFITTADTLIGTQFGVSRGAGSTRTSDRILIIPRSIPPGTYWVGFLIDPTNALGETNEGNNSQELPVQIQVF